MYKKFDELFIDETKYGTKIKTDKYLSEGKYPIVDQGQKKISGYTDIEEGIFKEVPAIIFGDHTRLIKYIDVPFFIGADGVKIIRSRLKKVNYKYLYYSLLNVHIPNTGYNRHFKWLKETKIFYPDSEKQKHIVEVLDKISLIIEKKNKQIEQCDFLLKSLFIEMFGDPSTNPKKWVKTPLHKLCHISSSRRIYQNEQTLQGIPFLRISDLSNLINNGNTKVELYISEERYEELKSKNQVPKSGDILITSRGTLGECYIIKEDDKFYFQDGMISWMFDFVNYILPTYLKYLFDMREFKREITSRQIGTTVSYLSIEMIKKLQIMLPNIKLQYKFSELINKIDKSKFASFSHLSA